MQAIASSTAVRPQFAGAKKSFAAKKVRAPASDARGGRSRERIVFPPRLFARTRGMRRAGDPAPSRDD
jgi:hypothetical protein